MEIRLLRAFVTLAEHRNFNRAAQALSMTQPALTKQMQSLEADIGGPLFRRGRHGADLTELGRALLPDARDAVDGADAFARRARRLARGETGHLSVGFGLSSITSAPRAVAAFRRRYPQVGVTLDDMSSHTQIERLRRGELHVGFVRLPVHNGLASLELGGDTLALALPATANGDHPTEPGGDARRLDRLLDTHGLVKLAKAKGPGLAAQVEDFLASRGLAPETVQEAHDLQTVLALVAAGVGAALVPAEAGRIAPGRVALLPIDDPAAGWRIGVAWDPNPLAAHVADFLAVVREPAHGATTRLPPRTR